MVKKLVIEQVARQVVRRLFPSLKWLQCQLCGAFNALPYRRNHGLNLCDVCRTSSETGVWN